MVFAQLEQRIRRWSNERFSIVKKQPHLHLKISTTFTPFLRLDFTIRQEG